MEFSGTWSADLNKVGLQKHQPGSLSSDDITNIYILFWGLDKGVTNVEYAVGDTGIKLWTNQERNYNDLDKKLTFIVVLDY